MMLMMISYPQRPQLQHIRFPTQCLREMFAYFHLVDYMAKDIDDEIEEEDEEERQP